jgi:hypothetical protein
MAANPLLLEHRDFAKGLQPSGVTRESRWRLFDFPLKVEWLIASNCQSFWAGVFLVMFRFPSEAQL